MIATTADPLVLPDHSRTAYDELLELYARQGPRVPVPVMLSALVVAGLAWEQAPRWMTIGWVALVAVVLTIRGAVVWWMPRPGNPLPLRTRLSLVAVVSGMGGLVHGASVMFWPYLNPLEHAVLSMFVLGLCAGAVATEMGYLPVFAAYLLPMLTPLSFSWANAISGPGKPWYGGASGVMLVLFMCYGVLLLVLARDTFKLFADSFESRRRLSAALEQAESANRSKTRFLASASHDLRQPMHTLTLFGAALAMRPLDDRTRDIAQQMNVAMQALSTQLDALLDVSKLDAGVMLVKAGNFSLPYFLRRVGDEFKPMAERRGLQLQIDVEEALVNCYTDPVLFERVVRNLIDNAIKYTAQGSVTVTCRRTLAGFEVRVRDTGAGIPAEEQERVFEEFYQIGNPERDRTQGLGLGLSIVRRLAELLQLDLAMTSVVGSGTEFVLQVPLAMGALNAPPPPALPPAAPIAGLHVLVIDDEEGVRQGMRTLLEGLGCRASLATGIETADQMAAAVRPDIVLADFRLRAGEDGIQAVKRLRVRYPGLPALLISGDTAPERLRDAADAGLRLLHKPVAVDTLVQSIREESGRSGRGVSSQG